MGRSQLEEGITWLRRAVHSERTVEAALTAEPTASATTPDDAPQDRASSGVDLGG